MTTDPNATAGAVGRVLDTVDKGMEIGGGILPSLSTPVAIAFIICSSLAFMAALATAAWWWRRHDKIEQDRNELMKSLVEKSTQPQSSGNIGELTTIIGHVVEESAVTSRNMAEAIDRLAIAQTESITALGGLTARVESHEKTAPDCRECSRTLAAIKIPTKTSSTPRKRKPSTTTKREI